MPILRSDRAIGVLRSTAALRANRARITAKGKMRDQSKPMAVPVNSACALTGLGRTSIYKLIGDGALTSVSIGRRRLILMASIERLLSAGQVAA